MRSGLSKLGAVIQALAESLDLGKGLQAQRAAEVFPSVAGEQINAHAWPEGVRGDTLLIVTDSPVWSHQLQMLEPELIARLKQAVGEDCPVTRLRFRSGSRRRAFDGGLQGDGGGNEAGVTLERRQPRRISRRDLAEIRAAAGQAEDDGIARALAGALRAQVADDRKREGTDGGDESPHGPRPAPR